MKRFYPLEVAFADIMEMNEKNFALQDIGKALKRKTLEACGGVRNKSPAQLGYVRVRDGKFPLI